MRLIKEMFDFQLSETVVNQILEYQEKWEACKSLGFIDPESIGEMYHENKQLKGDLKFMSDRADYHAHEEFLIAQKLETQEFGIESFRVENKQLKEELGHEKKYNEDLDEEIKRLKNFKSPLSCLFS